MNRREFLKLTPAFPVAAITASLLIKEEGKEPIEMSVAVLKTQPGDVLILTSDELMSAMQAERVQGYIKHKFGDRFEALLLSGGLKLEGVVRP